MTPRHTLLLLLLAPFACDPAPTPGAPAPEPLPQHEDTRPNPLEHTPQTPPVPQGNHLDPLACGVPDAGYPPSILAWNIHWSPLDNCALFGADAQVHLYFDLLDGASVDPPRHLQAPCTAGQLAADLGNTTSVHGMYLVSSATSGKQSERRPIDQDVHNPYDLYFLVPQPR
jgi:hypothetical protein